MGVFELTLVGVFSFLLFLRVVVVVILAYAVIRPVRACPACFLPTVPVRVRWRLLMPSSFEWRWCPDCGWQGPGRTGDESGYVRPRRSLPRPRRDKDVQVPPPEDGAQ